MEYRKLGKTGLEVSELALGTMQFGWTADEAAAFAIMDAYVEAGGNPDATDAIMAEIDLQDLRDEVDRLIREGQLDEALFMTWELHGKYPKILEDVVVGKEARKLLADARAIRCFQPGGFRISVKDHRRNIHVLPINKT